MRACTYCKKIRPASAAKCPDDGASLQEVSVDAVPAELSARFGTLEAFARGETGSLFLGPTDDAGAPLLLKIFGDHVGASLAERTRWKREMRKQTALIHPHLPRLLDEGETAGRLWLLRAFAPGETLAVRTRRLGRMAVPDVLGVAAQVASALDELHRQGLVQRDVKPGHIVTLQRGQGPLLVQLIDSGSAGRLDARAGLETYGTPGYAAPEIAAGRPASFRSDLYALGCVMYELLTGRLPFLAATLPGLTQAQRDNDPEPLDPSLPGPVRNLISALLAVDPRRRPFSAQQVRRTLEPFLPAGIPAAPNGGRPSLPPPPSAASLRLPTSDKTQELAIEDLRAADDRSLSFPTQELDLLDIDGAPPSSKTQELELVDLESLVPRASSERRTAAPSGVRRSSMPASEAAARAGRSSVGMQSADAHARLRGAPSSAATRGDQSSASSRAERARPALPADQPLAVASSGDPPQPGRADSFGPMAGAAASARSSGAPTSGVRASLPAEPGVAPRRSVPPPPPPEANRQKITSAGTLRARGPSAPPPPPGRTAQPTAAGEPARRSSTPPSPQPTAAGDPARRSSRPPSPQPTAAGDSARRSSRPPGPQPTAAGDSTERSTTPFDRPPTSGVDTARPAGMAASSPQPSAAGGSARRSNLPAPGEASSPSTSSALAQGRVAQPASANERARKPSPSVDDDAPTMAIPPRAASPVPYVREPAAAPSEPRAKVSSQFDLESLFDDSLGAAPAADGGGRPSDLPAPARPSSPVREAAAPSRPSTAPSTPTSARSARAGFAAQMAARTVTLRGGIAAIGRGQPPAGEPATQPGIRVKSVEELSAVPAVAPAADGGQASAAAALAAQVRAEQARADAARAAAELEDANHESSVQFRTAEHPRETSAGGVGAPSDSPSLAAVARGRDAGSPTSATPSRNIESGATGRPRDSGSLASAAPSASVEVGALAPGSSLPSPPKREVPAAVSGGVAAQPMSEDLTGPVARDRSRAPALPFTTQAQRPGGHRQLGPLWWGVAALLVFAVSYRVAFGPSEPRHASPPKHKLKPWQTQLIVPGAPSSGTTAALALGPQPSAAGSQPSAAKPHSAAPAPASAAADPQPTASTQAPARPQPTAAGPESKSDRSSVPSSPPVDAPPAPPTEANPAGAASANAKPNAAQPPSAAEDEIADDQAGTLRAADAGKGFLRGGSASERSGVVAYRARHNPELDYKAKARQLYQAAQYKEAAEAYLHATHRSPSDAAAFAGLGASWLAAGVPEKSIAAYQRAVQLKPEVSGFQAALGRAYLAKGDRARARAAYGKALALDPDNQAAKTGLASLH